MMPVVPVVTGFPTVHRDAAGLTELRVLGFHAGSDLRHVGDEVSTKPHGVWGAGLACLVIALRVGSGNAEKQCEDCHRRKTNTTNKPHSDLPQFLEAIGATVRLAAAPAAVNGVVVAYD